MRILVELEFDENDLGPKWMNRDNLELLLYGKHSTKKELLKVYSFKEVTSQSAVEADAEKRCECGGEIEYYRCIKCGMLNP